MVLSLDSDNCNPATLEIDSPTNFCVEREEYANGIAKLTLRVEIDAEQFDHLAITWCKKRKLHGALGGPIGNEFGSPDCEYSAYDDAAEDAELIKIVKEREEQDEISANLEYDNIFDVIADSSDEANALKEQSDKMIKDRDAFELKGLARNHSDAQQIEGAAKGMLAKIKATQEVSDEESLLGLIQEHLESLVNENDEKNNLSSLLILN
tara:strand:- start:186 stop:812 length:627 start_codon:yes stop_codon:yes gene_type:complete